MEEVDASRFQKLSYSRAKRYVCFLLGRKTLASFANDGMIGLYELDSNDSRRPEPLDNELQLGPHDLYAPHETPSSITESRVLLDNAIEDFREHEINLENLSDLPLTIQAWLKKHKRVLFEDSNIISAADVEKTYERMKEMRETPI